MVDVFYDNFYCHARILSFPRVVAYHLHIFCCAQLKHNVTFQYVLYGMSF